MTTDAATGFTVWLTGLSGAGKSTLAQALAVDVRARGRQVAVLDGDALRLTLCAGLGFTRTDRDENIRRVAFVAQLLAQYGVVVLVAAISPYRDARTAARAVHVTPFVEVHVDCSLVEVTRRDTRGLYARASRGDVPHMTGVSDPYESPVAPDVRVQTDRQSLDACVGILLRALSDRALL